MSGRKSKDKGARYERWVAQELSEWSGIQLVRTPMSGGWVGEIGDIVPRDRGVVFPLSVECKKQEGWDLRHIFGEEGMASPVTDWWLQTLDQADAYEDIIGRQVFPMMVFSRNRYPNYVAVEMYDGWWLMEQNNIHPDIPSCIRTKCRDQDTTHSVLILTMTEFLRSFSYQSITTMDDEFGEWLKATQHGDFEAYL